MNFKYEETKDISLILKRVVRNGVAILTFLDGSIFLEKLGVWT